MVPNREGHPPSTPILHQRSITETLTSHASCPISFPVSLADLPTHNLLNLLYVWDVHFLCKSSRPQKTFKTPSKTSKILQKPSNRFKRLIIPFSWVWMLLTFDKYDRKLENWIIIHHYPFSNILLLEIILLQKHDHDGRLELSVYVSVCARTTMPMVRATYIYLWAVS